MHAWQPCYEYISALVADRQEEHCLVKHIDVLHITFLYTGLLTEGLTLQVLRCHTSAHQAELLRKGQKSFLVTGDVYRRDSIDASHYPVFHQMEGLYVLSDEEIEASGKSGTELAAHDLKFVLSGLTRHLFGDVEMKFVDAYFPFTVSSTCSQELCSCFH